MDDEWHVGEAVFGSHSGRTPQPTVRTSANSPLQIATMPVGDSGAGIGITLCPGKKGSSILGAPWDRQLGTDIGAIRDLGASAVLTLLESHEFELLGVEALPYAVRDAGMVWHHAPIPDGDVPGKAFDAAWATIGQQLLNDLTEGCSIVVHCRGSLGRAGIIAAKLLVMMGEDAATAIEKSTVLDLDCSKRQTSKTEPQLYIVTSDKQI